MTFVAMFVLLYVIYSFGLLHVSHLYGLAGVGFALLVISLYTISKLRSNPDLQKTLDKFEEATEKNIERLRNQKNFKEEQDLEKKIQ